MVGDIIDVVPVEGIIDTSIIIDYLRWYTSAQAWLEDAAKRHFAITPIV